MSPFRTIANFDTLEEMQNDAEKGIPKQIPLDYNKPDKNSLDLHFADLARTNDCIVKKMILMNDKVSDIMKSLCCNCGNSKCTTNNESSQNLCTECNLIFCDDCKKVSTCMKCHKKVCSEHCIKCQICDKRSCKDKACIFDFRICKLCEATYCQEHYDQHKKFNKQELYKINCNTKICRIAIPNIPKLSLEFTSALVHARFLKEIKIRILIIRK